MNILNQILYVLLVLLHLNAKAQADISKLPKESEIIIGGITEAEFPGGNGVWYKFLSKNLNNYIASDKGAPAGSYTVKVQFWIDTTGKVIEVKPLTNFGIGMEEELIRVISKSVVWIPAKQGNRLVRAKKLQPIAFNMEKQATTNFNKFYP
jgi:hypothetical protein